MNKVIIKNNNDPKQAVCMLDETLFHNANGYLGVRACLEEGTPDGCRTMRGTYINGFYDVIPMKQAEALCNLVDEKDTMLNVADTQTVKAVLDGEPFDLSTGRLIEHTRVLNMEEGVTLRKAVWCSPKGNCYEIRVKRMTSFVLPNLFYLEYAVTPLEKDATVRLISSHIADVANYCDPDDPRLAAESCKNLNVQEMSLRGGISYQVSTTCKSNLSMCSAVKNRMTDHEGKLICGEPLEGNERFDESFTLTIPKGETAVLEKFCIYTDSRRAADVKEEALTLISRVLEKGSAYYLSQQKAYLDRFWDNAEVEIFGDEATSRAAAFNMYELLQSAPKDDCCSIAAKGLSGEGYEGHYFWDTETFLFPFFLMTDPDLAKMILNFRYHTLPQAKENAALLGHKKGALYPWRTISGKECSGYYVSGTAAYHINADIAYAVISYYLTADDLSFIADKGIEILIETSRLWMDLGSYDAGGSFVLNVVTGPDEYTCMVNNNYYTNAAAKYALEWTVRLAGLFLAGSTYGRSAGNTGKTAVCGSEAEKENADREKALKAGAEKLKALGITETELADMKQAAEKMLLLYDEKLGINPQDDSFLRKPVWDFAGTPKENYPLLLHYHPLHLYRYQVCKQADTVLAYFMFEDLEKIETMRRSYEYYEKITTHDSSLSTCVFSIVANRLGLRKEGLSYFGDSARMDLENLHSNTTDGIHTANMGGCYMAVVNGFAGIRTTENSLTIAPYVPAVWKGYRLKFIYRGRKLELSATRETVEIRLLEGKELELTVYGKARKLTAAGSVTVPAEENYIPATDSENPNKTKLRKPWKG